MHPAWLCCKSSEYPDIPTLSRLARRVPQHLKLRTYFCANPELSDFLQRNAPQSWCSPAQAGIHKKLVQVEQEISQFRFKIENCRWAAKQCYNGSFIYSTFICSGFFPSAFGTFISNTPFLEFASLATGFMASEKVHDLRNFPEFLFFSSIFFLDLFRNVNKITFPDRRTDSGRICSIPDHKSWWNSELFQYGCDLRSNKGDLNLWCIVVEIISSTFFIKRESSPLIIS